MIKMNAPIAGAHYTSDTRNYPWHRPPDITGYDEAVEYMIQMIDAEEKTEMVFAMLKIEAHIATVVSTLLLQVISKGKIPIDLAILIAGPVARYVEIISEDVGIKTEMGVDNKNRMVITPTLLRTALGIVEEDESEATADGTLYTPDGNMYEGATHTMEGVTMSGATHSSDSVTLTDSPPAEAPTGLMAPPNPAVAPPDEQAAMLGDVPVSEEPEYVV